MKRLKKYSSKLVDFSLIMDLIPDIAKLYFSGKMTDVLLSDVQQVRQRQQRLECVIVLQFLHVFTISFECGLCR